MIIKRDKYLRELQNRIVAFRKLKENLTQNNVEEKEVDLDIMRSFMKEEGLIR